MAVRLDQQIGYDIHLSLSEKILSEDFALNQKNTEKFINSILREDLRFTSTPYLCGFFYQGKVYDKVSNLYRSWDKRVELPKEYHFKMNQLIDNKSELEKDKKSIVLYLRDVFVIAETFGDVLALTPPAYHTNLRDETKYIYVSEEPRLEESIRGNFLIKNRKMVDLFKQYLMGKILTDGI